jgi:hypothetical protein
VRVPWGPKIAIGALGGMLLAGCGPTSVAQDDLKVADAPAPEGNGSVGESVGPEALEPDEARAVGIYSVLIEQVVPVDHGFGGAPSPFKDVMVLETPVNDMFGDARPAARPLATEVPEAIRAELAELPAVTFVRGEEASSSRSAGMSDVVITLGAIEPTAEGARVAMAHRCGGKCGGVRTYVVEERSGSWRSTGTVGPAVRF